MNSKDNFEINYCKKSEITLEEYNKEFVTLPCNCGKKGCKGWVVVCNNPISIKAHKDLYMR